MEGKLQRTLFVPTPTPPHHGSAADEPTSTSIYKPNENRGFPTRHPSPERRAKGEETGGFAGRTRRNLGRLPCTFSTVAEEEGKG